MGAGSCGDELQHSLDLQTAWKGFAGNGAEIEGVQLSGWKSDCVCNDEKV